MVKNLTILFFICFIGCEINSEQLIKNERVNFENIKFNAVSKDLNFNNSEVGDEVDYTKKLISNWFNNNIKIDGTIVINNVFTKFLNYSPFYLKINILSMRLF